MRKTLMAAFLVLLGYAPVCAQTSDSATLTIAVAGSTPLMLNGSDLASIKRVQVVVKDTSGKEETCSGFNLIDLLAKAGFSLAEQDPVFSNKLIMLADQHNGQPLGKDKGPYHSR